MRIKKSIKFFKTFVVFKELLDFVHDIVYFFIISVSLRSNLIDETMIG